MRLAVSGLPRLVAICSMVFYYPLSLNTQTPPSNKNSLPINKTHPDLLHTTIANTVSILHQSYQKASTKQSGLISNWGRCPSID